ncbi:MAG: MFS transporter [Planctomycetaceae bacterium]|jgi:MFS family permease|nr:MFS transporter [Planctomycetaceae bacterium]
MASLKRNEGFASLNVLQAFGAANDNIFKQLVIMAVTTGGIWSYQFGLNGEFYISLFFSAPFILLAGFLGQFSDKYSKRTVVIFVKLWEVLLAICCIAALYSGNFESVIICVMLLGIQSTLFSPTKLGIIPELVPHEQISNANGLLGMVSNVAIILGTVVGGFFYDQYETSYVSQDMLPGNIPPALSEAFTSEQFAVESGVVWLVAPGLCILLLACIGLKCAFRLPKLQPKNPQLKIRFGYHGFFGVNVAMIRQAFGTPLLAVTAAYGAFFVIPGIALLNMATYKDHLGIDAFMASTQGAFLAFSIGVGGVVVGKRSRGRLRPRFILTGSIGMTVAFSLLSIAPPNYWVTVSLLAAAGFFAGFYMIPLQSLLQVLTTDKDRGRFIGMNTVTTMIGFVAGNYLFSLGKVTLALSPPTIYLFCAGVGAVMFFPLRLRWIPWFERALATGIEVQTTNPLGKGR